MRPHAPHIETLKQAHGFPGAYVVRAIGDNTPAFLAAVMQAASDVLKPAPPPTLTSRVSAGGRHCAVRLTCEVETAEHVLQLYAALQAVAGLRMLL